MNKKRPIPPQLRWVKEDVNFGNLLPFLVSLYVGLFILSILLSLLNIH